MRIFFIPAKSSLKLTTISVISTLILLFSARFSNAQITPDANGIVYVTEAGTGDGSDWDNATADLHNAIHTADVQKVFVAVGEYKVGDNSFVMKNGVEIYGGFDPANNIKTLDDTRILPTATPSVIEGSIINGQNSRAVIWNNNNGLDNTAILDGFTLTNGHGTTGGGVYNNGASPMLSNLWIKGNTATSDGGAMFNINSSSPVMTNVTIENNTANYAGGIFNRNSSSPVMTNVIIKNNTAINDGGGMYNDVSASPVMTNVSITGNTAQNGAGMYNRTNSSPVMTNVLIADNTAATNGGAIRNEATSSPQLVNVTIANNNGSNAIYATNGTTTIDNSIVLGTVSGTYTAQYSLIEGNAGGTDGNLNGTGITADAVFTNPSGGDFTLKMGSPAVDKGSNALFAGLDANTKDLAGNARVFDSANNGIIDLGPYESAFTPGIKYVKPTATGTGDGNSWANATADLIGAINAAGVTKVYVAIGRYYYQNIGPVNLKSGVEIYGGFDPVNDETNWNTRFLPNKQTGSLTSSGNINTPFSGSVLDGTTWFYSGNSYRIVVNNGVNNSAVLDGFTVAGGYCYLGVGGGIQNINASPTLRNLLITNNLAIQGAGIHNNNSSPIVTDVIICHNTSSPTFTSGGEGAGICNAGNSSPVFTNVLVVGNWAGEENYGGGVYHSGSGTATFINCSFQNNHSGSSGSTVLNSVLVNASATGTVSFINSIVYGSLIGTYTAQHSMIEGNTDFSNGNIDMTGHSAINVFINPTTSYGDYYTDLGNYALDYAVVAADAGNNVLYPALDETSTDIAGNARLDNFASVIDLGPYESHYTPIVPTGGIAYVRPSAVGDGDGSSWENAAGNLQHAIATAGVSQIYAAVGNYPVGYHSFVMKNNLEIYGGFDPENNIRTLNDARILPSLSAEGSALDGRNALPVIFNEFTASNPLDNTALLDGFTVKNGNYTILYQGAVPAGGGIRNVYASPVFNHVVIKNNRTNLTGGGVFNQYGDPVFMNTILTGNTADDGRSGMYNLYPSSVTCINYLSFGNTSSRTNREIWVAGGVTTTFINATIVGQTANDVQLYSEGATIINSVIPNGIFNSTVSVLKNTLIPGAIADTDDTNIDASAYALTDIFTDPANNDYTLKNSSPAINAGSNALFSGLDANTTDLAGNLRLAGTTIDMGPYENPYGALPVRWISFDGHLSDRHQVVLTWKTEEHNISHYEAERSADGRDFRIVGTVAAGVAGSGNYSLTDPAPVSGTVYYRIRQVDLDGTFSYSRIISLASGTSTRLIAYPSPVRESVTIELSAEHIGSRVRLVSTMGVVLQRLEVKEGILKLDMRKYPSGIYLLQTTDGKVVKLVKE